MQAGQEVPLRLVLEQMQERVLNDGSSHRVFKRYFTAEQLADELGGARVLFDGRWFVVVKSPR